MPARTLGVFMINTLGHRGRNNNLNLLRFVAASMVLLSHSFALSTGTWQAEPLVNIIGMSLGSIAVDIFFVVSGFLVTGSMLSRKSVYAFLWARALRIYPALLIAILFCVLLIGTVFTTHPLNSYFLDSETQKYLLKNVIMVFGSTGHLPGVFENLPFKNAVNGSLWTLPWELRMYVLMAMFGLLLHIKKIPSERIFNSAIVILAVVFTFFYLYVNLMD